MTITMKSQIVYTCSPQKRSSTGYTTNDVILMRKFSEWQYGEQEKINRNEIINELLFHAHQRSAREIWLKAKDFLQIAESDKCKKHFEKLAKKYLDKYIYGT